MEWNSFFQNWGFWVVLGIVVVGYAVYRIIQKLKDKRKDEKEKANYNVYVDDKKLKEDNIEEKFDLGKEYPKIEEVNESLSKKIQRINNDVKRIKEEQSKGLLEIKKLQKEIENKVIILKNKYISLKEKERIIKDVLK